VDAGEHLERKLAAMRAHRTQIEVDPPFYALSDGVGQLASGVEWFVRSRGPEVSGAGLFGSA
jgi:N-acetyl-1-D-myo-inositol-2-amino-2-deoxy-alpha-D-glucopyranoside deacetylase